MHDLLPVSDKAIQYTVVVQCMAHAIMQQPIILEIKVIQYWGVRATLRIVSFCPMNTDCTLTNILLTFLLSPLCFWGLI